MDLITQLKQLGETTSPRLEVILADMSQANIGLDKFPKDKYPVMVVLPYNGIDRLGMCGLWTMEVDFNALVLWREPPPTLDYDISKLDPVAVVPMRKLARQMMNKLIKSGLLDTASVGDVTYVPVYAQFDEHLHGVSMRTRFNINESAVC